MYHGILRTTIPPTRINDDLILNSEHWKVLLQYQEIFVGQDYQSELITNKVRIGDDFSVNFFNRCFLYLITETVADYPYPYLTEKTWKAVVSRMPFMIVGAKHTLKQLHEFGFQTFDRWWDESYDAAPTAAERISLIVQELKKISTLSYHCRIDMRKEMESVVNHNHHHLNNFVSSDLAYIRKNL
jgi:hypothetical protein